MAYTLKAQKRTTKHAEREALKHQGKLLGVVYGPQFKSTPVAVDALPFLKLYNEVGESTLIDFELEGVTEPVKVLLQDVHYDPVTDKMTHIDFRQVDMNKEIDAEVNVVYEGEAPVIKEQGGTLVKNFDTIEIRCLPKDLLSSIVVNLGSLKTYEDAVRVKDLPLPSTVKAILEPETVVVTAVPVEEEKEDTGPQSVADIEVIGKVKEEEGAAEGEGEKKDDKSGKEEKKPEAKK